MVCHQLTVIFVGCHHIGGYPLFTGFGSQCADHIVCLISRNFKDGDAVSTDDVFYDRYGQTNSLWSFFALGFILFISFVTEGGTWWIECYSNMGRVFFFEYIFKSIYKAQYGGCIESFRVNTGIFDEGIVCPVYECVGI